MTSPGRRTAVKPSRNSRNEPEEDDAKPYIIVTDIGKGSFATVYKGYHEVCVLCIALDLVWFSSVDIGNQRNSRHQSCEEGQALCEVAGEPAERD